LDENHPNYTGWAFVCADDLSRLYELAGG
jgi:hypothetical protein